MVRSYDDLDKQRGLQPVPDPVLAQKLSQRRDHGTDQAEDEPEAAALPNLFRLDKQPANLTGGTLKDYQVEGLNWLYKLYQARLNGILADEMGLGKTIQSIAILAQIESEKTQHEILNRRSFHIVVVPKVTLGKWR